MIYFYSSAFLILLSLVLSFFITNKWAAIAWRVANTLSLGSLLYISYLLLNDLNYVGVTLFKLINSI